MYQLNSLEDTIVAIATATGQGGIGIVRLSGKESLSIADRMFKTKKGLKPSEFENFKVHYGWVIKTEADAVDNGEIVDEALLTVMCTPRSYTKEDVVEISCHGGIISVRAVFQLALSLGARLAEPGEFTKRAFLNGRIDLPQAEAVLDVIQSKTDAFLKVSSNQLKGDLTIELENIRELLTNNYTEMEAIINFPEDDLDASRRETIENRIQTAAGRVNKLLESSNHGRILKEGIKIVLCGKSNVGKSSLLNILLKQPRAIVSEIAGTTRDAIEEVAQINGIPFQLVDTAGILEPRDLIEEEAVKRSRMYIERADLIILVLDMESGIEEQDLKLIEQIKDKKTLVVVNKCDLDSNIDQKQLAEFFNNEDVIEISALKRTGIEVLERKIIEKVCQTAQIDTHGVLISNARHIAALQNGLDALLQAKKIMGEGLSLEFVSEEVKSTINCLDSITGRNIDHDLLDKIFTEFCIGK